MSILENVKSVADTVHEIQNLELYARVLGIQGDIMELLEKNKQLAADNEDLQRKLALMGKMTFKQPFYFQDGDETPYCPSCWEDYKKAIHLHVGLVHNGRTRWDCPRCKYQFRLGESPSGGSLPRPPRTGQWS